MKALVIGGNGFIGSHLVDYLLKKQHTVRVFDKLPERHRAPLKGVDYRLSSVDNGSDLNEAMIGIDVVYHLAGSSVPSTSGQNLIADIQNNLISTLDILSLVVKRGITRFVYFSSGGAVYGNPTKTPIPEEHALRPISSYGILKATAESYIELYQRTYGLKPLIVRPSNPYGPRQGHFLAQGVISTFLRKVKMGDDLVVLGDGRATKDYIYITDMIELCGELSFTDATGVYNIGTGIGTSVNELIEKIQHITQMKQRIIYKDSQYYDVGNFILDISKAKKFLGEKKFTSLDIGIQNVWDWLNANQ